MPVGDAFSQWATALYNRFPNRPKRMSALDAANAMKAMAEARRARAEADKMDRGPGPGEMSKAKADDAQSRFYDAQARAADRREKDVDRPGNRAVPARSAAAGYAGGGLPYMAPGSGSALPTAASQPTAPMAGAEYDYTPIDYTPMLGGGTDFGGDYAASIPGGGEVGGAPISEAIPSALPSATGGTTGIEGAGEGFGELSTVLNAPQDNTQGTPTPMDNAAYPGEAGVNPDYAVPMDTYGRGTYSSTAGGTVGEDELVVPREMNPYRDMPDTPISGSDAEAKFAPGLYAMKQVANALPSAESVGRAIVETPVNAVRGAADLIGRGVKAWAGMGPSTEAMAQDMTGRFARGGLPSGAETPPPQSQPATLQEPQRAPMQLPASEIAENNRVIAASQAARAKPQFTAADYYRQNPGVEGAWDRMKSGKTMEALPGTTSGTSGAPGGMPPSQAPGQTQTMFTPDDASQANAEKMYDAIRMRNATSAGAGGGGIMSYDADTGKALSMTALPTNQERGVSDNPYGDAQNAMVTSLMQDYRSGKASREDVLMGLAGIAKMNEPTKIAQAKATEEGKTARTQMQIDAANKRHAETLAQRTAGQDKTLSAKTIDTEHEAREKVKDQYNKDYTKMMEIEDPEERNNRLMDLNKNFYTNMLPPEARQLAEVPNTFENYAYYIQKKAYEKYMANPKDPKAADLWRRVQDPKAMATMKAEHQQLLRQREAMIKQRAGQR